LENLLKQAIADHKAGNLRLAEESYSQILSAEPDNTDALNAMGILRLQSENPRAALECFDRAARLSPETAKYHNNIANAQLALEKWHWLRTMPIFVPMSRRPACAPAMSRARKKISARP
jgi:tetratricopeptide (TPR) repeat protein